MVMLAIFAILGAALGAYVRPRAVGVVVALALAGLIRFGLFMLASAIAAAPHRAEWLAAIRDGAGDPRTGYLATVAAAGAGAFFAALLSLMLDERRPQAIALFPDGDMRRRMRSGRYRRLEGMVEERPLQNAAEARLHAAYDD